jgi:hypothetical protein
MQISHAVDDLQIVLGVAVRRVNSKMGNCDFGRTRECILFNKTMPDEPEFREVAHCGGSVTVSISRDARGRGQYQQTWRHCRPVQAVIFAVYALPQGIVLCQVNLGGIGSRQDPPPVPGAYQVFIASDSEGKFGRQCPACNGYWRSDLIAQFCPYCGIQGGVTEFLTIAQRSYVQQYCSKMNEALRADVDGDYIIDMDAVADAADAAIDNKPAFYYVELSQQNRFTCEACGGFNDILGTFGYCAVCGTRNDLQELSRKTIQTLRDRINTGGPYEGCVRDAVAAFDSFVGQYVKLLIRRVPLTQARRNRLENARFHNLKWVATELEETFDIKILEGLESDDVEFATLMFHRRHVYEHGGGEADEEYICNSGDKSVRLKQALRESLDSAHRIAGSVLKMVTNLHRAFHEIFPADERRIQRHKRR